MIDDPVVLHDRYRCIDAKQLVCYQNSNDDTKNRFNQLYYAKLDNNLLDDVITNLNENIKNIFGKNYRLCENWRYDLDHEDKTVTLKSPDGIDKVYESNFTGTFEELMKQNGWKLVGIIKDYDWSGNYFDSNNDKKHFDCDSLGIFLEDSMVVISSDNMIFSYSKKGPNSCKKTETDSAIKIYSNGDAKEATSIMLRNTFDKFRKLGIKLYERYNKEQQLIERIFGEGSKISSYNS